MHVGVLLMAHGTPSSLDDMPEYLRLVRGGRPPSAELIAEMRHNYEAIGGCSPLTTLTLAQADRLRAKLGANVAVAVGMRNWRPFIADALVELGAAGVTRHDRHSDGAAVLLPQRPKVHRRRDRRASLRDGVRGRGIVSRSSAAARRLRRARAPRRACRRRAGRLHGAQPAGPRHRGRRSLRGRSRGDGARCGRAGRNRALRMRLSKRGTDAEPWIGPDLGALIRRGRRPAGGASSRCRSASSATTPRFSSTSTCRPLPPRGRGRHDAPHRVAQHVGVVHLGVGRSRAATAMTPCQRAPAQMPLVSCLGSSLAFGAPSAAAALGTLFGRRCILSPPQRGCRVGGPVRPALLLLRYSRYPGSSRLAGRAPRSEIHCTSDADSSPGHAR